MNTHSAPSALRRRDEILKVVREQTIHSQEELQQRLAARGFVVAQPTLSRDLRELGLAKSAREGYVAPGAGGDFAAGTADREHRLAEMERAFKTFVQRVATAHTLVIVRTPPAAAHAVGLALDRAELPEVVGSIAGDDTVFVATGSPETARKLAARLTEILSRPRPARKGRA